MTQRRSLDEHVALFSTFAARIGELSPSAWSAIEARCAALNDASFDALLARAALTAKSRELWLSEVAEPYGLLRAIKVFSDATQHAIALAGEFVAEFYAPPTGVAGVPPNAERPTARTMSARVAALAAAHLRLETALRPWTSLHPGVVAAVRAAGEAVLRHDWLTPTAFADLYQYVAPEVPFESLEPPPKQPLTTGAS